MTRAIRLHETGGPDVLRWEDVELAPPAAGEIRVKHTAIGLNFIDTYHRTGLYEIPLPAVLGSEAAGVVEALGEGVSGFARGDRVACATGPLGAYAEARNVPASVLVKLPDGVDDRVAAACMLKGLTAHYLLGMAPPKGTILVHAAAGGVGTLLTQWARHEGKTVIATVGSEEKAALACEHGAQHVILYRSEDVAKRVREITNGEGCDVVYDAVGKDTFASSLDALRVRGLFVSYGQASGPVGSIDPLVFSAKGSLFFTRPKLGDYARTPAELAARAASLFDALERGALRVRIAQTYPLAEAARAHADLEARKTTGSTLLLP